ncbi:MAG: TRAP transporter substrate-binding protein DctP [Myxococcales bacterium]
MLRFTVIASIAIAALCVPGAPRRAKAGLEREIRVATLAPRNSTFMREFQRLDRRLRKETGGGVGFRLYASGVAGDEKDVIRKMRAGQLDAAMVTSDGLGLVLPEVSVLRAPGVITSYEQLGAVQKVMLPEFDREFESKGFKLIAWGEAGEYRYFSRRPVQEPADIRTMRPWLWPSSPIMRETWRAIGANPVPLGMGEVYGALQTRMVDLVESTAIAYVAMQWHTTDLAHVTEDSSGVLTGAWLMNESVFEGLKPEWREVLMELASENNQSNRVRTRKADLQAYKRLVKRGMKVSKLSDAGKRKMAEINSRVCARLAGRIYPKELLERVEAIAGAHR